MSRAVVVFNPAARNAPSRDRLRAAAGAIGGGWQVDLVETAAPGDATRHAAKAALAGAALVFACGGDGTVNEVVNGLAGSETTLGVLRGGMGNVFAKEAGIPRDPAAALLLLRTGVRRRFDLGRAGERYFLLMSGVGFDAAVVRDLPATPKRRLGSTAYALWGLRELLRYRARPARLRLDGEVHKTEALYWLLLGNTRSYGGVLNVHAAALVDDGLLDAYVFEGRGAGWLATTAARLAARRQQGAPGVSFRRLSELVVESAGLPVQADGEYVGETPMRFTVAPRALDVLMPPGAGLALFGSREPFV